MLLNSKLWLCTVFLFIIRIPDFYAESLSLYSKVSVILSKWTSFHAKVPVWVFTWERRPVRLSWGVLLAPSALHKARGRVVLKWVRLCRCARNYLCARNVYH